jgi:PAS domain S-box-containing protein
MTLAHQFIDLFDSVSASAGILLLYLGAVSALRMRSERWRQVHLGLVFGVCASIARIYPVHIAPGVVASSAPACAALGALFGGLWGGLATGVLAAVMRTFIGDPGAFAGIFSVLLALASGWGVRWLARRFGHGIGARHLLLLGLATVVTSSGAFLLLPRGWDSGLLPMYAGIQVVVLPSATLLLGMLVVWDARRRDLTRQLDDRERQFGTISDNLPGTLYRMRLNPDGKLSYTYMSDWVRRSHGVTGAEVVANAGLTDATMLPEENEARWDFLRHSMQTLQPGTREFRMRRKDGTLVWVRTYSTPHKDPDGFFVWDGFTVDISDEKLREAELRGSLDALAESERRFRAMVANIPGIVWQEVQRADGRWEYTYMSERMTDISGWTAADVMADRGVLAQVYLPEDEAERGKAADESARQLSARIREFRIRHRDGSFRWLRSHSRPHRAANGDVVWDGVTLDITAEKARETELEASRKLVTVVTANMPGALYRRRVMPDGSLSFIYFAGRLLEAFGLTPDDVVKDPRRLKALLHPDDVAAQERMLAAANEDLKPRTAALRLVTPSGEVRWIEQQSHADVQPDGEVLRDGIMIDVTATRKMEAALAESERRFRAIVTNVPGIVYQSRSSADGKLAYSFVSDRIQDFYGFTAAELVADATVMQRVLLPDQDNAREQSYRDAISDMSVRRWDFRVRHPDGTVHWMRSQASPHRLENGDIVWDGLTVDITEQRRLEEDLRTTERLQALGQLTAGIAHQFNNVLMIVSGNAELLAAELAQTPHLASAVEQIQAAVARGSDITIELQAFARSGPLRAESRSVTEVILAIKALMRTVLGPELELETDVAPALLPVLVDSERLRNALLHLVLNARDAMPEGGQIHLAARNLEIAADASRTTGLRPGYYVEIVVQDEGVGMSPEVLAHAKEPYFTTKQVGQGNGLGLSMVHGFVTQSGGRMDISSAPGKGTHVALLLPTAATHELPAAVGGA